MGELRQHQPIPLSLDGRGIKGEGDSKIVPPHRHTGFKAVSTGRQGDTGEQDNTNRIPLLLGGRGSKPVPVPDTGSRG